MLLKIKVSIEPCLVSVVVLMRGCSGTGEYEKISLLTTKTRLHHCIKGNRPRLDRCLRIHCLFYCRKCICMPLGTCPNAHMINPPMVTPNHQWGISSHQLVKNVQFIMCAQVDEYITCIQQCYTLNRAGRKHSMQHQWSLSHFWSGCMQTIHAIACLHLNQHPPLPL